MLKFIVFNVSNFITGIDWPSSLVIIRENAALVECVQRFNAATLHEISFLPKLNFEAHSLFGYQSHIRNMDREHQFSCRDVVDLLNPKNEMDSEVRGAREGLKNLVLELLRDREPDFKGVMHLKVMALLLQVSSGGQCQVWHTDEDAADQELTYSILIPCHEQSAHIFLTAMDEKLGPIGVKPVLSLGDMVYWNARLVTHAGSSADRVPTGQFLHAAVFISVGSSPPESAVMKIHSRPDIDQWKKCAHPIIRFCVRCRRGVQACEPNMKFCGLCLESGQFEATAVVCRWCHDSDDHLHSRLLIPDAANNELVCAVWQGLGLNAPERKLCVHGNPNFRVMSLSERLLLHFDKDELCGGFCFWRDFLRHVVPDESHFTPAHRGMDPEAPLPWKFFFKYFVDQGRVRLVCRRRYVILRVTAMLCGFTSLFHHSNLSNCLIPVFVVSNAVSAHAGACLDAFRLAQANTDRVLLDRFDVDRIARALLWLEGDGVTTHCSCSGWEEESEGTVVPLSFHHQVRKCPGATLRISSGLKQPKDFDVWGNLFFSQVVNEGEEYFNFFSVKIYLILVGRHFQSIQEINPKEGSAVIMTDEPSNESRNPDSPIVNDGSVNLKYFSEQMFLTAQQRKS